MNIIELKPLFNKIFEQIETLSEEKEKLKEETEKLREEIQKYKMLFTEISEIPSTNEVKNVIIEQSEHKVERSESPKKRGRKSLNLTEEEKKLRKSEYNRRYRERQGNK